MNIARTKFQAVVVPFNVIDIVNQQSSQIMPVKRQKNGQFLMLFGGKNSDSTRIDSIEVYDHYQNKWLTNQKFKMRKAKSGFSSVYYHNQQAQMDYVFVIGGNDGQVQNRVEFLDFRDLTW